MKKVIKTLAGGKSARGAFCVLAAHTFVIVAVRAVFSLADIKLRAQLSAHTPRPDHLVFQLSIRISVEHEDRR